MKLFILLLIFFGSIEAMSLRSDLRLHARSETSLAARIASLENVTKNLDIEAFYLEDDLIGRGFLKQILLAKAQKPHLQIRLILDAWGSGTINESMACQLSNAGISTKFFNKNPNFFNQQLSHRKIWIADNRAFIGGRNLSEENFSAGDKVSETVLTDWDVEVRGEIVKSIQNSFDQAWSHKYTRFSDCSFSSTTGNPWIKKILNEKKLKVTAIDKELVWKKAEVQWFADPLGNTKYRDVSRQVAYLIRLSRRSLQIENAYFLPVGIIAQELGRAQKRGLRMEFYINGPSMTNWITKYSTCLPMNEIQWWMSTGAKVTFTSKEKKTHAKSLFIDDEILAIGSFNFDSRSINTNAETLLVIRNSPEIFNEYKIEHRTRINEGFTAKNISQVFVNYNFSAVSTNECSNLSGLKPFLKNFF